MYVHKEDLKRRYYTATGEVPSQEVIDYDFRVCESSIV